MVFSPKACVAWHSLSLSLSPSLTRTHSDTNTVTHTHIESPSLPSRLLSPSLLAVAANGLSKNTTCLLRDLILTHCSPWRANERVYEKTSKREGGRILVAASPIFGRVKYNGKRRKRVMERFSVDRGRKSEKHSHTKGRRDSWLEFSLISENAKNFIDVGSQLRLGSNSIMG